MNFENLEKLPNLSKFESLESFMIICSLWLRESPGIGESRSLTEVSILKCHSLETLLDLSGCEKLPYLMVAKSNKLTQLLGLEKLDLIRLKICWCHHWKQYQNFQKHASRNMKTKMDS